MSPQVEAAVFLYTSQEISGLYETIERYSGKQIRYQVRLAFVCVCAWTESALKPWVSVLQLFCLKKKT